MCCLLLFYLLIHFFVGACQAGSIEKFLDNFHTVESGHCYRSAQLRPNRLARYIKKYGIKTVINLRGENKLCAWWNAEKDISDKFGVAFYNLNFSAQRYESDADLKALLDIYKTAPRPILIHCRSGIDRTGEAAALWVIELQKKSVKDALKQLSLRYGYLRFRRPQKYFLVKHWKGVDALANPAKSGC